MKECSDITCGLQYSSSQLNTHAESASKLVTAMAESNDTNCVSIICLNWRVKKQEYLQLLINIKLCFYNSHTTLCSRGSNRSYFGHDWGNWRGGLKGEGVIKTC